LIFDTLLWAKIYQGRQFLPTFGSVKGIARVFNGLKCLGGIMHLKSTAGHQISNLIFENKLFPPRHLSQLKTRAISLT
jgi:hypothetical protein